MTWYHVGNNESREFKCGHCGNVVATRVGYHHNPPTSKLIYVCPHCDKPTYFEPGTQLPGVAPGVEVRHLPGDVQALYREARNSAAAGSHTSAVLTCRKLLMNVAVGLGADPGK